MVSNEVLVMSLPRDQYFALDADASLLWRLLRSGMAGQQLAAAYAEQRGLTPDEAAAEADSYLEAWHRLGLLTTETLGAPIESLPTSSEAGHPAAGDFSRQGDRVARFRFSLMLRLARARLEVSAWLRWYGAAGSLKRMQARKSRSLPAITLPDVVATFMPIRSLLRLGPESCLPQSLTLALVLREHGVLPDICFGVQRFPFCAHAWVEVEGMALTDSAEQLARYVVIARF